MENFRSSRRNLSLWAVLGGLVLWPALAAAQSPETADTAPGTPDVIQPHQSDAKSPDAKPDNKPDTQAPPDKRILGVLPNYRTANAMAVYEPLTTKQKFTIAMKDSFDWPNYIVSGAFAALYQAEDSHPSFGQGLKGYAHRYWTSYVDQSMGNLMTEAVMPTLLHEDPRYFRKNVGPTKSRLWYAVTRVLVTRTDSGGTRFNFSEVLGNGVMASVGNAYYPDEVGFGDTMARMGTQIATDAFSNVLKEFWPDIKRHLHHKSADSQ